MKSKKLSKILDGINFIEEEFAVIDGYDDCIVGIMERFGQNRTLCYNKEKILKKLTKKMSYEEAIDFFEYNIIGTWIGDNTPCFISEK